MKTLKNVLLYIVLGLMGFVSLPFIFVEFRNFFSFDFIYVNNPFVSGLAYFLRGIYFLLILVQSVFAILFMVNKKKFCIILFATQVSLFIGALLSLLFYEYYTPRKNGALNVPLLQNGVIYLSFVGMGADSTDYCPMEVCIFLIWYRKNKIAA